MAANDNEKLVMVVDDDPDIVTYLTTVLEDKGYKTVSAINGADALGKVSENCPDLICLDISMPEKSGVKTFRELREGEKTSAIPIILVTGVSKDVDNFMKYLSEKTNKHPHDDFVAKPIERDEFLDKVKKALGD